MRLAGKSAQSPLRIRSVLRLAQNFALEHHNGIAGDDYAVRVTGKNLVALTLGDGTRHLFGKQRHIEFFSAVGGYDLEIGDDERKQLFPPRRGAR